MISYSHFCGQHCWSETNIIGNEFLFFISFHCPKLFYCSPCPTAAPASLNMHVVSTNFAKTFVCKSEYDVVLWRHKPRISSNNDHQTLCSILEFRRRHLIKQSRRASPHLCTPGLPDWPFHGQFRKILPFFNCAGHEKTHLAILCHFLVCHCKIKVSSNILSFYIFWTVFMSLIVTAKPWQFNLFFALKCVVMI